MLRILKDLVIAGASVTGDGLAARRAHAVNGDTLLARDRSPRGRTILVAALTLIGLCVPSGKAAAAAQLVEYYHLDALGNVRVVTNDQGAVIERHDYLPFGEEWTPQAGGQPRRFTGKERDAETGLDYFGARYYGATIGRFTTVDPAMTLTENTLDPQRWNRYAYGRNNPLKFVDPDGRDVTLFYRPSSGMLDFGHVFLYVRNDRSGESAYFDYFPENGLTALNKPNQKRLDDHSSLTIETNEAQEQAMLVNIKAFAEHPEKYNFTITGSRDESTCVTQCTNFMSMGGLGEFLYRKPQTVWNKAYEKYGDLQKEGGKDPQPGREYGRASSGRPAADQKALPPRKLLFDDKGKKVE